MEMQYEYVYIDVGHQSQTSSRPLASYPKIATNAAFVTFNKSHFWHIVLIVLRICLFIAFMCTNRVNLESMGLNLNSSLTVGLAMHLLRRSCDLTELRSITVENSIRDHPHESGDQDIAYVITSGIPRKA